jgi:hypothetical protein
LAYLTGQPVLILKEGTERSRDRDARRSNMIAAQVIAKFPSFEEAYKVGSRFWPGITLEIQEILAWDKVKEIVLSQAKEAAEQ